MLRIRDIWKLCALELKYFFKIYRYYFLNEKDLIIGKLNLWIIRKILNSDGLKWSNFEDFVQHRINNTYVRQAVVRGRLLSMKLWSEEMERIYVFLMECLREIDQ